MKTFDRNKIHNIPIIFQDWANVIATESRAEVRENYAQKFEDVRDYCNWALELNQDRRNENIKYKR